MSGTASRSPFLALLLVAACAPAPYRVAPSAAGVTEPQLSVETMGRGADGQAWTFRAYAPNQSVATDWRSVLPQVVEDWGRRITDSSDRAWGDHKDSDYLIACRKHRVVRLWRGDCLAALGKQGTTSYCDDRDGDDCPDLRIERGSRWLWLSSRTGWVVEQP